METAYNEIKIWAGITSQEKFMLMWAVITLVLVLIWAVSGVVKDTRKFVENEKRRNLKVGKWERLKKVIENTIEINRKTVVESDMFRKLGEIYEGLSELEQYGKLYPDEFELKISKYKHTLKILEESTEKIKDMKEKEKTIEELYKVFRLMYEDMLPEGLDGRVAKDLEQESKMLKELNKGGIEYMWK